ncbi:MAG: ABC transporter permease [Actinobacteria bacterium]|nr:MAG: ABC transporter permease [Actinomycetota bacterium]
MIARFRAMKPQELAAAAFRLRELGIVLALVGVVIFFGARATNFLTGSNWQDIAQNVSIVVVVAVGETMVILTRNIDLSVGSIVGLCGYLVAATLVHHPSIPVEVVALISIAIGLGLGVVNGLLVAVARIPAIIATLATLAIFRGIDAEITGGKNITAYQLPDRFLRLAASKPAGFPALAWIAVGVAVLGAAMLRWAPWARDFYAIGSNPDAARFAGIRAGRRVITAFALSGALAGLGGFLFASRFPTLDSFAANGFELTVITAVVIGGVNVFGGSGTILGVVLGAVLVATISDGFTLLRLSEFWKIFFNGLAIVVAVTIDALVTRRLQEALRRRRAGLLVAPGAGADA